MSRSTKKRAKFTPEQREVVMGLYREVLEQIATGGPRTNRKRLASSLLAFVDYALGLK